MCVASFATHLHTHEHHLQTQAQAALAQAQGQGQAQQGQAQPTQQQTQNNNAPRPQLNGQVVPQLRTQVNISQQQRIPAANATRVSAQMLPVPVQAAQQRVLACECEYDGSGL
jgi:chromatin modification-related protein VID21